MEKQYLMTPGPTMIPESVSQALSRPIPHHRHPEFQNLLEYVRAGLKYVFQTKEEVLILASTGTGAMEAAVSNLFSPGECVVTINAGKFGERWTKIAASFSLKPVEITIEPGCGLDGLDFNRLEKTLAENPDAKAVLFQASETSTGVQLPTQEICKILKSKNLLSVCDAITACGVQKLPMDEWGIDVLITGSQKALMIPPGLAFIALSQKAWSFASSGRLPKFYFDLKKEKTALCKNQTQWTPAISLIQGLAESLRMIQELGLERLHERFLLYSRATRESVKALGLELFSKAMPSMAVTAVQVPQEIQKNHPAKIIPTLMREKYGVSIVGGQDELESKIFRLSHLGYCGKFDIVTAISALELVLNDLNMIVDFGKGVGAALKCFSEVRLKN